MPQGRHVLIVMLIATLAGASALAQNQARQPNQQPLVIRGGLLIDGTGAAPVPNSVIVIVNGRIQSAGSSTSVTVPAGAQVIDAAGKTVIPGLVDSHVHLRNHHTQDYLYWGVTTVGDLGGPPGWLTMYKDAVEQGRVASPYILNGGNRFNAPLRPELVNNLNAVLTGNAGNAFITDTASAEREIARAKQVRQDAIKMRDRLTPAQMKMVIDIAHKNGLPVFAHFDSANVNQGQPLLGTDEIVDTGLDVHVHMFGLVKATAPAAIVDQIRKGGNNPIPWNQLDTGKYAPIIQKMVANNMFLNPTIANVFATASSHLSELAGINTDFVNSPMGQSAPRPVRDRYAQSFRPGPQQNAAALAEGYKRVGQFVKEFADAGGKIISGTDTGAGRIGTSGITLHQEMLMLREIGVPPMKVIQSSTSWAMEAWGKGKEAGTLEAGKRADVLVLNRNPLDDMRATMDIFRIVQGGNVIDRDGLASRRQEISRPGLMQEGFPNPALSVPFIDEIWPELASTRDRNVPPVVIKGSNFSRNSFVLVNDQIVRGTVRGDNEITVNIPSNVTRNPGVYPLVVVQPGNGGGVSNTFYFIVTSK
jgi:imidazolonepropionase-like amidohydrolase